MMTASTSGVTPGDLDGDDSPLIPTPARQLPVTVLAGESQAVEGLDAVAEEVPVALVYNGLAHAVMMASPTDLEDFAVGFSLSEGILMSAEELLDWDCQVETTEDGRTGLTLQLSITTRRMVQLKERRRTLAGRTGCGLCGRERLEDAMRPPAALDVERESGWTGLDRSALQQAAESLIGLQTLQHLTGAAHAAAWCRPDGTIDLLREDVGRHNALDKLIGALARRREAEHDASFEPGFALITSRASYEMVHKAATAGMSVLAAVSAPTALAVRTAQAAGLTLAGFTRGGRTVVYANPYRLRDGI
jgi:FdhD protein